MEEQIQDFKYFKNKNNSAKEILWFNEKDEKILEEEGIIFYNI
jgi:hypothetical protein